MHLSDWIAVAVIILSAIGHAAWLVHIINQRVSEVRFELQMLSHRVTSKCRDNHPVEVA